MIITYVILEHFHKLNNYHTSVEEWCCKGGGEGWGVGGWSMNNVHCKLSCDMKWMSTNKVGPLSIAPGGICERWEYSGHLNRSGVVELSVTLGRPYVHVAHSYWLDLPGKEGRKEGEIPSPPMPLFAGIFYIT